MLTLPSTGKIQDLLAALLIGMMILTSPMSAASSSQVIQFNGLISPAAWGAPFQLPGSPPPGPGPFPPPPPPPLLVVLLPSDGHTMSGQGSVQQGIFVMLIVLMTDPVTGMPTLNFVGNSTMANFQVDARLTSASLSATLQGFDLVSFSPKTVTLSVSWTAIDPLTGTLSPITRTTMESRVQFGGFSLLLHMSSQMRLATASGTLAVVGGPTITLPPAPATIARADFGIITRTPLA